MERYFSFKSVKVKMLTAFECLRCDDFVLLLLKKLHSHQFTLKALLKCLFLLHFWIHAYLAIELNFIKDYTRSRVFRYSPRISHTQISVAEGALVLPYKISKNVY